MQDIRLPPNARIAFLCSGDTLDNELSWLIYWYLQNLQVGRIIIMDRVYGHPTNGPAICSKVSSRILETFPHIELIILSSFEQFLEFCKATQIDLIVSFGFCHDTMLVLPDDCPKDQPQWITDSRLDELAKQACWDRACLYEDLANALYKPTKSYPKWLYFACAGFDLLQPHAITDASRFRLMAKDNLKRLPSWWQEEKLQSIAKSD